MHRKNEKLIHFRRKAWKEKKLGDLDIDRRRILTWSLRKYRVTIRTALIWLRIETSDGLLLTR